MTEFKTVHVNHEAWKCLRIEATKRNVRMDMLASKILIHSLGKEKENKNKK